MIDALMCQRNNTVMRKDRLLLLLLYKLCVVYYNIIYCYYAIR